MCTLFPPIAWPHKWISLPTFVILRERENHSESQR